LIHWLTVLNREDGLKPLCEKGLEVVPGLVEVEVAVPRLMPAVR